MTDEAAYGSREDLPSVIEMRRMLLGFSVLGWVGGRRMRQQAKELRSTLDELTSTVDGFYRLLGERGWIFHDDLDLTAMRQLAESADGAVAEARFVEYYQSGDHILWPLRRLHHHAAMRPRLELLHLALNDYEQGRYYSCVLVLLTVTDGFVNDFEPAVRRGLHARDSDEMSPWDKAAGHHLGLSRVHRTYAQKVSKMDTAEQVSLRRNGIMHGMLPNFNNVVLATKAWNLLFAVSDWADAEVERRKPAEDEPGLKQLLKRHAEFQQVKRRSDEFEPYSATEPESFEGLREFATAAEFLQQWENRQWGLLAAHFMRFGNKPFEVGPAAKEARAIFESFPLEAWEITGVRRKASSLAFVDACLRVAGVEHPSAMRFVLCDDDNGVELDPELGTWRIAPYFPMSFWTHIDEAD